MLLLLPATDDRGSIVGFLCRLEVDEFFLLVSLLCTLLLFPCPLNPVGLEDPKGPKPTEVANAIPEAAWEDSV